MSLPLPEPEPGEPARALVDRAGEVFTVFDQQDSGCVSYGLALVDRRVFVKTATSPAAAESLCSALRLHRSVQHPAVLPLLQALQAADSPVLVYPWWDGEVLNHSTVNGGRDRTAPGHPLARFRTLPVPRIEAAVEDLLDAHRAVAAAGFVAVDFYDGSMMYDFEQHALRLIDLDEYHPGAFTAHERLPGSSRFMSPEEYGGGSLIDERTTVYVLGRATRLLLDAGDREAAWRGSEEQLEVVSRATDPDPCRRFGTVADLHDSWRDATVKGSRGS